MAPRTRAGTRGSAGVGSTARSSSPKIFSAAAIDDCMTAYFWLKSRIGTKKRWMYWMNATTVPTSTSPTACSRPPSHNIAAMETVLTASTKEKSAASSLFER